MLNSDICRCRGDTIPKSGRDSKPCPARDTCARYTSWRDRKIGKQPMMVSVMYAPNARKNGCNLKIIHKQEPTK